MSTDTLLRHNAKLASHQATRSAADAAPGEWVAVRPYRAGGAAASQAGMVRNGWHGYEPAGAYEARVDRGDEIDILYVRRPNTGAVPDEH